MYNEPRPVLLGDGLPQLLDADRIGLRVAALAQAKPLEQRLRQRAAAAFGEKRLPGDQLDPRRVALCRPPVPADAHIAGGDATHPPGLVVQYLGGGEAGIDLDPQFLGLARQPAAQIAEADDVIAVIVHLRRSRQPQRAGFGQVKKTVFGRRRVEGRPAVPPIRDELVQRTRLEYRAGQDMRADLGALLDDADGKLAAGSGGELLQTDRRGETLHPLALYLPCPIRHSGSPPPLLPHRL